MRLLALLCLLTATVTGFARAEAPQVMMEDLLVERIRALLILEDTAASGNSDAPALERSMLDSLEAVSFDSDAVKLRGARAILAITLSGGPPGPAAKILKSGNLPATEQRLLAGAVAFSSGDSPKAQQYFSGIDARRLGPSIGGRVALVQAILLPDAQGAEKQRLFELAASLMPGTLVEDAAERRGALFAAQNHAYRRMWKLARRYVARLDSSLYAKQFLAEFAQRVANLPSADLLANRMELERFVDLLRPDDRVAWYLNLAEQETRKGRKEFAQFAAARAMREAAPQSPAWQRARAYDAAWSITGGEYDRALEALRHTDIDCLTPQERDLLRAATEVGGQIRADASGAESPSATRPTRQFLAADQAALSARADNLLQLAETTLTEADSK